MSEQQQQRQRRPLPAPRHGASAWKWPTSSAPTAPRSWRGTGRSWRRRSGGPCRTWWRAARRRWAATCSVAAMWPRGIAYNSCRNRHCPKCQGSRTATWLQREASFLCRWTTTTWCSRCRRRWPRWCGRTGGAATRCCSGRLARRCGKWRRLPSTWGPGGPGGGAAHLGPGPALPSAPARGGDRRWPGLCRRGTVTAPPRWVACRPGFFLPVRVLSRVFRGKYLALLRQAQAAGELSWHGELAGLAEPAAFAAWLRRAVPADWVVYAKPPFGGPEQVLKYLARYTHRVALSNRRLVSLEGACVTFTAKDYAAGGKQRLVRLSAAEFLRRWVQHVLPRGFVKIRHYGLLANRGREERLALCRALLALWTVLQTVVGVLSPEDEGQALGRRCCPACGSAQWVVVAELPRSPAGEARAQSSAAQPDTS